MSAFDPKRTLRQIGTFQCAGLSDYPAVVLSLEADDEAGRVHHASHRCGGYVAARWARATAIREGLPNRLPGRRLARGLRARDRGPTKGTAPNRLRRGKKYCHPLSV